MPPFHILILTSVLIITPLYSIAILLFNTEIQPRCRTIRALGSGVIVKSAIIFGLGLVGFVSEGQGAFWMPLLLATLTALAVYRILQFEGSFSHRC